MMLFSNKSVASFLAIGLVICYFLAFLYPEPWWGLHYFTFLPNPWRGWFLMILLVIVFVTLGNWGHGPIKSPIRLRLGEQTWPYLLALLAFGFFHNFPIVADYYGNARSFIPLLDTVVHKPPLGGVKQLIIPSIEPGSGRTGVMYWYEWISYLSGLKYQTIFRWMGSLCGAAFVYVWVQSVLAYSKTTLRRVMLIIAGATAPSLIIFMGHVETYAPLYLIVLLYFRLLSDFYLGGRVWDWLLLLVLLILGIRFHMLMCLVLPSFVMVSLQVFWPTPLFKKYILHLRGIFFSVFVPYVILLVSLYFLVFADHHDPRTLDHSNDLERLFLPIFSPAAPLDRYNLFSWNHIFDFLNNMLHWSPALWFILVVGIYKLSVAQIKARLDILVTGLSLIMITIFLFMFNPLLSMPMDWDLYAFPSFILLFFSLQVYGVDATEEVPQKDFINSILFCLMCLPAFWVHTSRTALSLRMEQIGVHVFKTYYQHASTYLLYSLLMESDQPALYDQRKAALLNKLAPLAIPGKDKHYGLLLLDSGISAYKEKADFASAEEYFRRALYYDPTSLEIRRWLVDTFLQLDQYETAAPHASILVDHEYPDKRTALDQALRCSLGANQKDAALALSLQLSKIEPDSEKFSRIATAIQNGQEPSALLPLMND